MKNNTKSSITLPPNEIKEILAIMKKTKAKSKVAVVRMGLRLLQQQLDKDVLQEQYRQAAATVRKTTIEELKDGSDIIDEIFD